MGKAKRNKNKARKDNPTGLLSVKELGLQEEELNNENVPSVIANVVEQVGWWISSRHLFLVLIF